MIPIMDRIVRKGRLWMARMENISQANIEHRRQLLERLTQSPPVSSESDADDSQVS